MSASLVSKIGLAPMEGVTDFAFRLWMGAVGSPPFAGTPFLRVTENFPKGDIPINFAPELTVLQGCVPYKLIPQIMTHDAQHFIRVAKKILQHTLYVDLNCGCPSTHAVGGGAGSSLLQHPQVLSQLIKKCLAELGPQRISVKIRTGFHSHHELDRIIATLEDLEIHHLTIHGRSRPQKYDGYSRWILITQVAERVPFPVAASGDITSFKSILDRHHYFDHIDHAIVGRGAPHNPWLFKEIRQGNPQKISPQTLPTILASLGLLYEAQSQNLYGLWDIAGSGTFFDISWQQRYESLVSLVKSRSYGVDCLPLDRFSLGRVKMIWNYMRSGLPQPFFNPQILRARDFPGFVAAFQKTCSTQSQIVLSHNPELDWVYTSSKKSPQQTDSLFT